MTKTSTSSREKALKRLLAKHGCPVPFHAVRTRFLGALSTPSAPISPLAAVKDLWGGELPPFACLDDVNELIAALVGGLWNELTQHHTHNQPFQLTHLPSEPSVSNLFQQSVVRVEELDGFIHGLFHGEEAIDLPERAHEAVGHLGELRTMTAAISDLLSRDANAPAHQIAKTFQHLAALTRIMETEIHEVVLSCAQARLDKSHDGSAAKPTVH